MMQPNISQTTAAIWSSMSFKKDQNGAILQLKHGSYKLPVLDEKETKVNISLLIESLRKECSVHDVSSLLMKCLDEIKFQYLLSHNGFRLAKGIAQGEKVIVADIYAFASVLAYCFDFLPPETPDTPITIVSGVMSPAGQDLGNNLLNQLWKTQGHTVFNLGTKIKPISWLEAIDKYTPDFLSISCMLNTCVTNLRELLNLLQARKDSVKICVGGMAMNKFTAVKLAQEYRIPLFHGTNFVTIQANSIIHCRKQQVDEKIIALPQDITDLSSGEIFCYQIPLSKIIIDKKIKSNTNEILSKFRFAVIVTNSSPSTDIRNKKILIRQLLQIETFLESTHCLALSFHYPFPCPFCLPKDCKKSEGKCMNPSYTRPFPKDFHINISKTIKNAKITEIGLGTIILVQ